MRVPELLAPAGNGESLRAAVSAGADAVYLGLEEFNARRNADNFTLENLKDACDYAHLRGVSVYITLNVEIMPSELTRAVELARNAYQAGADAVIVQDIGLAAELARFLPQIDLHMSTQMNIHSAAGISVAARLGAKRVTLARELSVAEIAELAQLADDFNMEVECFAHGALCVCYSGQCLMSSMIGGRSANRGLCAQACRLPYELFRADRKTACPAPGEHLLSPRDLCTVELIEGLCAADVASLKIEGRMKSADYVYGVVSVYREAIDEVAGTSASNDKGSTPPSSDRHSPSKREIAEQRSARLAEAFSRGFTTAYLEGHRGNDIMSYGRPNNRGVFAGRVSLVGDDFIEISPEIELHDGDVVEFWTNRGHFAQALPDGTTGKTGPVRLSVEQRVNKGDRVFRVRNAAMTFHGSEFEPRIPIQGYIALRVEQPMHALFIAEDGTQGEAWGDVVEPARTKPVTREDVRNHIDRLGQTPFTLANLDISLDDGVGVGFSRLHHLRTDALEALQGNLLDRYEAQPVSPYLEPEPLQIAHPAKPCSVAVWATNPGCARAARRAGCENIYVPLLNFRRGQAQLEGALQHEADQAGYPKQCIMALPTIDHDPIHGTRELRIAFDHWEYVREGKPVFADSIASAQRALELGALVEIGPHVPVTNAATLRLLHEWGVQKVWLSPELTLGQIADIAESSPIELGLFVAGAQELMVCEHCLLMSQGNCNERCESCERREIAHHLVDRKGFEFPVITDQMGRSHLYNGIELDALPYLPDLIDIGISSIMVDATFMDRRTTEAAVKRARRAIELAESGHRSIEKRRGTTTGHLFRGIL